MKSEKAKGTVRSISKRVLMIIIFIILLFVVIFIVISENKRAQQNRKNEEYVKAYPQKINAHLQEKYGKTFNVNPDFEDYYSGGPIPGTERHLPYEYEVWENEADGYAFKLWIITESEEEYEIKEIQDNYCWKFLSIETKKWFQNEMADILPREYKLICRTSPWDRFGDNINEKSPIKTYFETTRVDIRLLFYIITPPNNAEQDDEFTKEEVENAVKKFYEKYENLSLSFWYLQAKTEDAYKSINVREIENSVFTLHGKIKSIWDITDIEEKFEIEVPGTD